MRYEAELRFAKWGRQQEIIGRADGGPHVGDHAAVVEAMSVGKEALRGVSPDQVVLIVYHVYENGSRVSYAMTLDKYLAAIS